MLQHVVGHAYMPANFLGVCMVRQRNLFFSLLLMFSFNISSASDEQSIYRQVIGLYEQGTVLEDFDNIRGEYSGRCYDYYSTNVAMGGLLVMQKKKGSDNGPGFPITWLNKSTILTHYDFPDYYDDLLGIDRRLQEEIDNHLRRHDELSFYTTEWVTTSAYANTIMHFRKNGDNIVSVEFFEDTSKLDEDTLREFKRISYKRIHTACYFFKKIGEQ